MSEQPKYRSWTAQQKLEIVLAGMRGDRTARDVCREHGISETLYYGWRDKIFSAPGFDLQVFSDDGAAPESNRASVGLPHLTGFEDRLGHRAHATPGRRS